MTAAAVHLSDSVQALIDSRLDTIDRMLLGRLSRQDRLAIVREVESQIFELLQEREHEDLGRDDVLAVLGRLDPPEAYLPDEAGRACVRSHANPRRRSNRQAESRRLGRAQSGMIGLSALSVLLLFPIGYLAAASLNSEVLALFLCGGFVLIMFACSVVGLTLGIYARRAAPGLCSVWSRVCSVSCSRLPFQWSWSSEAISRRPPRRKASALPPRELPYASIARAESRSRGYRCPRRGRQPGSG